MLFGLTMSLDAPGAAPAGGYFESGGVDAGCGKHAASIAPKRIFVLRDADQAVEKSLQQVHGEDLMFVMSVERIGTPALAAGCGEASIGCARLTR